MGDQRLHGYSCSPPDVSGVDVVKHSGGRVCVFLWVLSRTGWSFAQSSKSSETLWKWMISESKGMGIMVMGLASLMPGRVELGLIIKLVCPMTVMCVVKILMGNYLRTWSFSFSLSCDFSQSRNQTEYIALQGGSKSLSQCPDQCCFWWPAACAIPLAKYIEYHPWMGPSGIESLRPMSLPS